ncbi:hypothetical protein [Roseibacillus ishigakijimensis]|uniref:Uncharacterized protein n=1 Tax=Roseibacillus ishigakijimensis TaxID=454146 RepID=A0A934RT75_9BACT|nr:hypothetical protein [Roseibacillus ishigakijimensis]MBK1835003.1 hypothetical protein [Roseibacillus ishigakijimensis]
MPQTWETILDFPEGICIAGVSITAREAVASRLNEFNFRQEVQVFPGQMLAMRVDFKTHESETGSRLEAFLLKLRGGAGVFRFGDPFHSLPMGRARGVPKVVTAIAGAQTFTTSGWQPNHPAQLLAGDYLQLGDRLYRVLDTVASDPSGNATLTVWPNLREDYAAETEVKLFNPTGLWRLASPESVFERQAAGQRHSTGMNLIEAL